MAKKFDLYEELQNLGFYKVDDEFGDVLRKDYQKIIDVAWVGKRTKYFIVRDIPLKKQNILSVLDS